MDDWLKFDMIAMERKQLNTLTTNYSYNHRAEELICTNYHSLIIVLSDGVKIAL